MYAIFRAQGKQFRAVSGATLRIPTLAAEPGDTVTFDEVLLAEKDGDVRVGRPSLDGAAVEAEIVGHGRGEKIVVYKMKRRKGYRRKQGHRQGFTEIKIVEISFPKAKKGKKKKPLDEPVAAVEVEEAAPAVEEAAPTVEEAAPTVETAGEDYDITAAARTLAEEHGIDLATIEGSGKDGRILKSDIDKAIKAQEGA